MINDNQTMSLNVANVSAGAERLVDGNVRVPQFQHTSATHSMATRTYSNIFTSLKYFFDILKMAA